MLFTYFLRLISPGNLARYTQKTIKTPGIRENEKEEKAGRQRDQIHV